MVGMQKACRAPKAWLLALLLLLAQEVSGSLQKCPAAPRGGGCPEGSAAACWSRQPGIPWACWPRALAPPFLSDNVAGNRICAAWPTPPGSAVPYYEGCCIVKVPSPIPVRPKALSWEEAYRKADAVLSEMSAAEKHSVMKGIGWKVHPWYERSKWYYVGNTPPIPRLGVPPLSFMDAGAGFSLYWGELVGTVTAWPSTLSLAATWDPPLAEIYATALGVEFRNKGANSVLGPVVNVHRPARGGRNSESISGEDPYLGAKMAAAYIKGVQSQGVAAVVKHWVFNEQETRRDKYNVVVDDKTAWELYYPPFEAAVEAGVSGVMCSYNLAGGSHVCESKKYLHDVLKQSMGFKGFVQSDWWAAHSTLSLQHGLDQEMPGNAFNGSPWFSPEKLKGEDPATIDQAARRVLAATFRLHLSSTCNPPHCRTAFHRNVSSPAHAQLARSLAAESIVLLKNEKRLLPLSLSSGRLAIIGPGAAAPPYNPNMPGQQHGDWATGDFYTVGGSGHVTAGNAVTPLDGIKKRALGLGMQVRAAVSSDMTTVTSVARGADVAIIVVGATSGESRDRKDLLLEHNGTALIEAVAAAAKRTVVLVEIPGAVVMPWRHSVDAIMAMFLGGQEAGDAWADVLFGDHAPAGRLPLMIPETEADTIPTTKAADIEYKEGMATSYRSKRFKAAYPFGHGLTYTQFEYSQAIVVQCNSPGGLVCIDVKVKNIGAVPGKEVAQLYLELPPEAQHPGPLLKGFHKTQLIAPWASTHIVFVLTSRDISYYDPSQEKFVEARGKATARIGGSSRDLATILDVDLGGKDRGNEGQAPKDLPGGRPLPLSGHRVHSKQSSGQSRLPSTLLIICCLLWASCIGILVPLAWRKALQVQSGQMTSLLP